jgi:hypothetical protein
MADRNQTIDRWLSERANVAGKSREALNPQAGLQTEPRAGGLQTWEPKRGAVLPGKGGPRGSIAGGGVREPV